MTRRGPDPKELRASLVDSGWSVTPPPSEAVGIALPPGAEDGRLPNYEDGPSPVTQIDTDLQSRLKAMQRASLGDMQRPPVPPLPPPPLSRPPPPSLPPPPPPSMAPPTRPSEAPLPSFGAASVPDADVEDDLDDEPLPRFGTASVPDTEPRQPPAPPIVRRAVSEPPEATEVMPPGAFAPSSAPPPRAAPTPAFAPPAPAFAPPAPAFAPPAAAFAAQAPVAVEAPPPPRVPATYLNTPTPSMLPAAPSLMTALRQRVRFAGGEVPLWSLITPMVLLLSLGSAFVAAAVGGGSTEAAPVASASPSVAASAPPVPSALASAIEPPAEAAPTPQQTPALPASSIDTEALEARRAEELSKDEALALANARRDREVSRVAQLRQKLKRDPGLFKDAATLTELRRAAEDPLTATDALSAMAEAPGPLSADLLYEMWTGTVVRNSATELARSLVFSKEVRAKASPELAVALDLRIAETCEQNQALLPKVSEKGDRRALGLLAKLARKFGCGPNKRLDCYPCLREDKAVDDAMAAVKKRREPKPFSGK